MDNKTYIKNLDEIKNNKKTLVSKEKHYIDHTTGEIIGTEVLSVQTQTKDDFVKLFVENMDYLGKSLDGFEFKTLFFILKKIDYQNSLIIDVTFKKNLSMAFEKKSASVISRAIKGLIEKNIILPINTEALKKHFQCYTGNGYYVNPNIIGKGSFRDIKNLRQTAVTDFDFEKNQLTKTISIEAKYEGEEDILSNPSNYKINNIEVIDNKKENIKGANILISKKENEEQNLFSNLEEENNIDLELELRELELKEAQLKLKKASLIKQMNQKGKENE